MVSTQSAVAFDFTMHRSKRRCFRKTKKRRGNKTRPCKGGGGCWHKQRRLWLASTAFWHASFHRRLCSTLKISLPHRLWLHSETAAKGSGRSKGKATTEPLDAFQQSTDCCWWLASFRFRLRPIFWKKRCAWLSWGRATWRKAASSEKNWAQGRECYGVNRSGRLNWPWVQFQVQASTTGWKWKDWSAIWTDIRDYDKLRRNLSLPAPRTRVLGLLL